MNPILRSDARVLGEKGASTLSGGTFVDHAPDILRANSQIGESLGDRLAYVVSIRLGAFQSLAPTGLPDFLFSEFRAKSQNQFDLGVHGELDQRPPRRLPGTANGGRTEIKPPIVDRNNDGIRRWRHFGKGQNEAPRNSRLPGPFPYCRDGHRHSAEVNVQNLVVETDNGLLVSFRSAEPLQQPKWLLQVLLLDLKSGDHSSRAGAEGFDRVKESDGAPE